MGTFVLLLVFSVAGGNASAGFGVHSQQVTGFTSSVACLTAAAQAKRVLAQSEGKVAVRVSALCIQVK